VTLVGAELVAGELCGCGICACVTPRNDVTNTPTAITFLKANERNCSKQIIVTQE